MEGDSTSKKIEGYSSFKINIKVEGNSNFKMFQNCYFLPLLDF